MFTGHKDTDLLVLSLLNDKSLLNIRSTCKYFYLLMDDTFWRNRFISSCCTVDHIINESWLSLYKNKKLYKFAADIYKEYKEDSLYRGIFATIYGNDNVESIIEENYPDFYSEDLSLLDILTFLKVDVEKWVGVFPNIQVEVWNIYYDYNDSRENFCRRWIFPSNLSIYEIYSNLKNTNWNKVFYKNPSNYHFNKDYIFPYHSDESFFYVLATDSKVHPIEEIN